MTDSLIYLPLMARRYPLTRKRFISFLWDKEINIVNHSFVVIVQDVVYVSNFKLRTTLVCSGYSTTNEE